VLLVTPSTPPLLAIALSLNSGVSEWNLLQMPLKPTSSLTIKVSSREISSITTLSLCDVCMLAVQDGGHLLLRLTQLAAAEPADLVPPIAAASTAAAAGGPGSSSSSSTGSQHSSSSGGGSEGAAGSTGSMSSVEEGDQDLQDRIAAVLKDSVAQAQGQVR